MTEPYDDEVDANAGKPTVYEALAQVSGAIGAIAKNLKNEAGGYGARSIDDVLNAVHTPLTDAGVVIMPEVLEADYATVQVGRNQTTMRQATLRVRYTFYGPRGDSVTAIGAGEAIDSADKATNKALSSALKYVLLHAFTIPLVGDDNDADREHHERSPRSTVTPAPEQMREKVREALASLDEVQAQIVREEWKERRIPPLNDTAWVEKGNDPFSADDAASAIILIDQVRGMKAAATPAPAGKPAEEAPTKDDGVVCVGCQKKIGKTIQPVTAEDGTGPYHPDCAPF